MSESEALLDPAGLGYDTASSDLTEADPTDTFIGGATEDDGPQ